MKNVIEVLEKQYQSFINQERDWNFFLGLADYIEFINKTPNSKQALNKIEESKLKEIENIERIEKEAVIELQKMKRELLKTIKTEKFTCEGLPEALLKLEDYEKGKIDPNHYKSSRLDEGLRNLIKVIAEKEGIKYEELVKKYPLLKYSLSKKLLARMGKSLEVHRKEETELWGAYEKLQLVYKIIHNKEDEEGAQKFKELLEEMEIIKDDGGNVYRFSLRQNKFSSSTDFRIKELKKDNYKLYATRIHNYLIQELSKEEAEKPVKEEKITGLPKTFEIQVKDRYIWINSYLLSKPHAVGSNLEFFEYIRNQPPNIKIERNKLPDFGGLSLKQEIKNKGFIKILNELGFKGEILKAYFPKRGKNMLIYRGNKITKKDLEKTGVKIPLFLKELELAHIKNSPE